MAFFFLKKNLSNLKESQKRKIKTERKNRKNKQEDSEFNITLDIYFEKTE